MVFLFYFDFFNITFKCFCQRGSNLTTFFFIGERFQTNTTISVPMTAQQWLGSFVIFQGVRNC